MILTTDWFAQKIINTKFKHNFNFVTNSDAKPQLGFCVFAESPEMVEKIESNWHTMTTHKHSKLTAVSRDNLLAKGINVPMADGFIPSPQYVVGVNGNEYLALPIRLVQLIALAYQEILSQADEYKACPRDELANSVTHSLLSITRDLDYLGIYIYVNDDLKSVQFKVNTYSITLDVEALTILVRFKQFSKFAYQELHSIRPLLTDVFGTEDGNSQRSTVTN